MLQLNIEGFLVLWPINPRRLLDDKDNLVEKQ